MHNENNIDSLYKMIQDLAEFNNINYVGVADLSIAYDFILEQGGKMIADFPFSITLGIDLMDAIVNELPNQSNYSALLNYRTHAYDIINQRLNLIASQVGSLIQNNGFKAMPIPASDRTDNDKICASISHKLSAHLAGLGWIGKNCLPT